MKLVVIESPYGGRHLNRNISYLNKAMLDSLMKNEAPFASHAIYPQCLDENNPEDRDWGIHAGYEWGAKADLIAFYVDYGWTRGMELALERYSDMGKRFEVRKIMSNEDWLKTDEQREDIRNTLTPSFNK